MLDLSGIEDGTFDGWNRKNGSDAMSIVEGEGLTATSKALKFAVGSSVTAAHSVQLYTPDISAVSGHNYEISFFVRSDKAGKARLTFAGLGNCLLYTSDAADDLLCGDLGGRSILKKKKNNKSTYLYHIL